MRRILSCKALFITPTFAWKINPIILWCADCNNKRFGPIEETDTHTDSFHCHHTCINSDLTCLVSFLSLRCCSRLSISSGGMGSPEQVWGWALWAGRPGPFLVLSCFLHLARLFWNQTWKIKGEALNMHTQIVKFLRNQQPIDWINHCKVFISAIVCRADCFKQLWNAFFVGQKFNDLPQFCQIEALFFAWRHRPCIDYQIKSSSNITLRGREYWKHGSA